MQNIQTTKDDIIQLIRLFKEPMAQKYCTNQHAVIKWGDYISAGISQCPVKKYPYQPSKIEWAYRADFTYDLEPTNLSYKNIFQGEDWIKSSLMDYRKYLH